MLFPYIVIVVLVAILDHFSWREWNVAPQRYVYQFIIKMKFIAIKIFTKFNYLLGFLELNKVNW